PRGGRRIGARLRVCQTPIRERQPTCPAVVPKSNFSTDQRSRTRSVSTDAGEVIPSFRRRNGPRSGIRPSNPTSAPRSLVLGEVQLADNGQGGGAAVRRGSARGRRGGSRRTGRTGRSCRRGPGSGSVA